MEINLLTYCICLSLILLTDILVYRQKFACAVLYWRCTVELEAVVGFRLDPLYYSISGRRPFERGYPVAASLPVGEKTGAGIFRRE